MAAVLPLIAEAQANGCLLLSEICVYLDCIGHPSPRGKSWSVPTLFTIMRITDDDRRKRDDAFAELISQARSDGALPNPAVAKWLNERGHRTARGKAWTAMNISRFEMQRAKEH